jgi:hypothetical protein
MPDHGLCGFGVSISLRLRGIDNPPHVVSLLGCQFDLPRIPIFFQSLRLGRTWNGNKALRSDPGESDLSDATLFLKGNLFDIFNNSTVFVKVLALKFGG